MRGERIEDEFEVTMERGKTSNTPKKRQSYFHSGCQTQFRPIKHMLDLVGMSGSDTIAGNRTYDSGVDLAGMPGSVTIAI